MDGAIGRFEDVVVGRSREIAIAAAVLLVASVMAAISSPGDGPEIAALDAPSDVVTETAEGESSALGNTGAEVSSGASDQPGSVFGDASDTAGTSTSTGTSTSQTGISSGDGAASGTGTTAAAGSDAGAADDQSGGGAADDEGGTTDGQTVDGTDGGADDADRGPSAEPAAPAGEPVKLGVHFDEDVSAAFAAFGASGAEEVGDIEQQVEALIDDINARGGLGGRPIEPVYLTSNPLQDTYETKAQQACAHFTEDNEVIAVVSTVRIPSNALLDCLSAAGTPLVWVYSFLLSDAQHAANPELIYTPGHITAERMDLFIDAIGSEGYFGDDPVVGMIRFDTPAYDRFAEDVVIPGLEARGLTLAEDFAYTAPSSAGAAGDTAAQLNSAVLRFKTVGVTHVLFAPTGGITQFLYGPIAENQDYRGIWGMTGMDGLNFLVNNVPKGQLEGAVAVGWNPRGDVAAADGPPLNAAQERCYATIGTSVGDGPAICEGLFFLEHAMARHAPGDVTNASIAAAVDSIGDGYTAVGGQRTRFGPGRHVGPAEARSIRYLTDCSCFRYQGAPRNIR